jgi:hypothetical protein
VVNTIPILLRSRYYVPLTFVATCVLTFGLIALMQQVPRMRWVVYKRDLPPKKEISLLQWARLDNKHPVGEG